MIKKTILIFICTAFTITSAYSKGWFVGFTPASLSLENLKIEKSANIVDNYRFTPPSNATTDIVNFVEQTIKAQCEIFQGTFYPIPDTSSSILINSENGNACPENLQSKIIKPTENNIKLGNEQYGYDFDWLKLSILNYNTFTSNSDKIGGNFILADFIIVKSFILGGGIGNITLNTDLGNKSESVILLNTAYEIQITNNVSFVIGVSVLNTKLKVSKTISNASLSVITFSFDKFSDGFPFESVQTGPVNKTEIITHTKEIKPTSNVYIRFVFGF